MKLTVGIPTYNRSDFLLCLLKSLSKQIRESANLDVEILVSDNASTDDTALAVKSFQENNSDVLIKYHCNKSNLGYDQNVNKVFQLASGQYVMTMGDDDDVEPDAIKNISLTLEENFGVKVLYIANSFYDVNLRNKVDINIPFFSNVGVNKYFKSADELFSVTREVFGGISGICLERKSWLESNVEKYFGTNWIHLGVSLSILRNSDAFVITQPLIKYRLDRDLIESRLEDLGKRF
jgi:glycosyltransferase involved in cell wall biosynthesis